MFIPRCDILAGVGLIVVLYLLLRKITTTKYPSLPLPPGPKSPAIINSLRGLPVSKAWDTYNRWSQKYGSDIIRVRTLTHDVIVLNSPEAISDLLERRSNIYSSRPQMVMFHTLLGFPSTAFMPYGHQWRVNRKIYNQQLNVIASEKFQIYQVEAARELVSVLLTSPEKYPDHCRHFAAGVVMNLAYGRKITREKDEIVMLTEATAKGFSQASQPGFFMVDNFPLLRYLPKWFPGTRGWRDFVAEVKGAIKTVRDVPFEEVKAELSEGKARPSFVANSLMELGTDDDANEEVQIIRYIAVGIFGAGSATTTSSLTTFLLAMMMHPEAQRKAQEELDQVIGNSRLPQFEDRPSLPYVTAVAKEVLRWFPVSPSALPHVLIEDDVYNGYRIPKGSIVIANTWNVLHDPRTYPEPFKFIPERFVPDKGGRAAKDPLINGAFGYGRRICPGRHLAGASLWIAVATVLSTFNIRPPLDENGQEVEVTFDFDSTPGILNHVPHFECRIEPRSEQAKRIIMEATLAS